MALKKMAFEEMIFEKISRWVLWTYFWSDEFAVNSPGWTKAVIVRYVFRWTRWTCPEIAKNLPWIINNAVIDPALLYIWLFLLGFSMVKNIQEFTMKWRVDQFLRTKTLTWIEVEVQKFLIRIFLFLRNPCSSKNCFTEYLLQKSHHRQLVEPKTRSQAKT